MAWHETNWSKVQTYTRPMWSVQKKKELPITYQTAKNRTHRRWTEHVVPLSVHRLFGPPISRASLHYMFQRNFCRNCFRNFGNMMCPRPISPSDATLNMARFVVSISTKGVFISRQVGYNAAGWTLHTRLMGLEASGVNRQVAHNRFRICIPYAPVMEHWPTFFPIAHM